MKIEITEGCMAWSTTVDDVEVTDMKPEEYNIFLDNLLAKLKTHILENTVNLNSVIQCFQYDDYESDNEPCDQCGDTVTTTTWNI